MAEAQLSAEEPITSQPLSRRQRLLDVIGWPVWIFDSFFLSQVVVIAGITLLQFAGTSFEKVNEAVFNTVLAAAVYLVAIAIVIKLPMPRRKPRVSLKSLGLGRWPQWHDFALTPVGYVAYTALSTVLLAAAIQVVPGFNSDQAQDVGFQNMSHTYEYILAFTTLVIIAPVAEEVLMRGYLYGKLRAVVPKYGAMLITAVTFGILHMQWNVGLDVFALSLIMTSLREATGSIWAGILLHIVKNGFAFYFLFINPTFLHTIGG